MKNYKNYIKSLENHNAMLVEFKRKTIEFLDFLTKQPPFPPFQYSKYHDMLDELKELDNIISAYEKPETESDKQLRDDLLNEDAARKQLEAGRYVLKSHTKHYPK